MSSVDATPESVVDAAKDVAEIGSTINSANSAALDATSSVQAPAADEVSASIAELLGAQSQTYQELSAQAAAFHRRFLELMNGAAGDAATEPVDGAD